MGEPKLNPPSAIPRRVRVRVAVPSVHVMDRTRVSGGTPPLQRLRKSRINRLSA
jgi:hypothetical protein